MSNTEIYNKNKIYSKQKQSALYLEFFREQNKNITNSIIHRHFGVGPLTKYLKKYGKEISFGKESDFDFFKKKKFQLILLGCKPSEGATYLHHLETLAKVPYRNFILIKKKCLHKKKIVYRHVEYFARKSNDYIENFNKIFNHPNIKKNLIVVKNKYSYSYSVSIEKLHKEGLKILKKNKYAFVKKK